MQILRAWVRRKFGQIEMLYSGEIISTFRTLVFSLKGLLYLISSFCMFVLGLCATAHIWRTEDDSEVTLSPFTVWVISFAGRPFSHLTGPKIFAIYSDLSLQSGFKPWLKSGQEFLLSEKLISIYARPMVRPVCLYKELVSPCVSAKSEFTKSSLLKIFFGPVGFPTDSSMRKLRKENEGWTLKPRTSYMFCKCSATATSQHIFNRAIKNKF